MRILITGGAGFVGSQLAGAFHAQSSQNRITVLDNLRRRGSELNLATFKKLGITFVHGDIRNPDDLRDLDGDFDVLIEASAEPSVLAGVGGSPSYVLATNLTGTLHCLEFARQRVAKTVFLSTSRVYSIDPLRSITLVEGATRWEPGANQTLPGISAKGVAESFPTHLPRSLYGATKLCSEQLLQEYVYAYGVKAVVNRCGVLAGPGQFGKSDQGVFTLWVANHVFKKALRYTGFGGTGKQVRDLLHPLDLFALLNLQLNSEHALAGSIYNVGGGASVSTSLLEFTGHCSEVTGNSVAIASDPATNPVDIPWYVSDASRVQQEFGWAPKRDVRTIVSEIHRWLVDNRRELGPLFGSTGE